ncbi:hypothetical protein HPB50_013578 [Hyalomma asiaticum]|uniref:Uncharacterized protein n=1 Tax=Hyalomma asiaticum TaxID=266040 RepID=A0ACB7RV51_HYAAI|nr:hypothetical protein HPB50_013578 [Hyalomma asiaticum]
MSSLRRLHLPSKAMRSFQLQPLLDANAAQYMESLLQAVRSPDTALHELRISLQGFGQGQCCDFFGAVAENRRLEMVSLYSVPDAVGVEEFCGTIRSFALSGRVTILNHVVDMGSVSTLQRCPEIAGVTVRMFPPIMGDVLEPVAMVFDELRCCDHVTSVRVRCQKYFGFHAVCSLVVYIKDASFLTDVEVRLDRSETDFSGEERQTIEAHLALACNTILVRVSIEKSIVSLDDVDLLLSGARMNRNLTRFGMTRGDFSSSVYSDWWLNGLCPLTNVGSSRRLTFAHIQECITRNTVMVRAAARFALGNVDGVKGARAIELMHNHPDVRAMVQEQAACRRSVARNMIEEALRRVQRCSLGDFMKFAGVVHADVKCLRDQPGTGTRLFDLNEYCLLHIRSFLKISDVVDVSSQDMS